MSRIDKAHDFLASKTTLLKEHTNKRMQCERYVDSMAEVTGQEISIAGYARDSCVHGVFSSYPVWTHKPNCTRCWMTESLRNGFGNPDLLALFAVSVLK